MFKPNRQSICAIAHQVVLVGIVVAALECEAAFHHSAQADAAKVEYPVAVRRLTIEQAHILKLMLAGETYSVTVADLGDDRETELYANDIWGVLKSAGLGLGRVRAGVSSKVGPGITLAGANPDAIALVARAFQAAGITVQRGNSSYAGDVVIIVGAQPPEPVAANAAAVLPAGAKDAWVAYVDRRLAAAIVRDGTMLRLRTLFDSVTSATTILPVTTPYTIHCDLAGGTIVFGYGNKIAAVRIFAMSVELPGEKPPALGVNENSIAAQQLRTKLCARISDKLKAIIKAQ